MVLDRLDGLGRGACIALVVAGFWFWWPIGLAMVLYLTVGRRRHGWSAGRWQPASTSGGSVGDGPFGAFRGRGCWSARGRPSGNRAFDDYRTETLRRLEEEQQEFDSYLERLRQARDKSEFDAFMAERRNRQTPQAPTNDA